MQNVRTRSPRYDNCVGARKCFAKIIYTLLMYTQRATRARTHTRLTCIKNTIMYQYWLICIVRNRIGSDLSTKFKNESWIILYYTAHTACMHPIPINRRQRIFCRKDVLLSGATNLFIHVYKQKKKKKKRTKEKKKKEAIFTWNSCMHWLICKQYWRLSQPCTFTHTHIHGCIHLNRWCWWWC